MFDRKKVILSLIGAASLFSAAPLHAETDDAVLLKIHNVVPLKDNSGKTTSCEFNTTIYNRTKTNINDITVDFTWSDDVSKLDEERQRIEASKNNRYGMGDAPSDDKSLLTSSITVPSLLAFRQKTIKSKINSDNCFLLMKDPLLSVRNCQIEDRKTSFSCPSLFKFISSIDPQYYTEFKPISLDDQNSQDAAQKDASRKEIDNLFNQIETGINKISATLNK